MVQEAPPFGRRRSEIMKAVSLPVLVLGLLVVVGLQVAERNGWLPDLLAPRADTIGNAAATDDLLCGPKSLHIALNLIGHPVSPDEIVEACTIKAGGVSFGDLTQFAAAQGLSASLRRLTWEDLLETTAVSILFVDDGHYVAVDARSAGTHGGNVRLFDPGHVAKWVDRQQLELRWHGDALVLLGDPEDQALAFGSYWHDVGFVNVDTQTFRIPVTNRSDVSCRLKVLETSCRCTTACFESERVASGEETYLEANLELTERRGHFQEKVRVTWIWDGVAESAEPVDVWLCGGRYADTLCRSDEFLGEIPDGDKFQKELYVHDPGDGTLLLDAANCRVQLQGKETEVEIPCTLAIERIGEFDAAIGSRGFYQVRAGDYRLTVSGVILLRSRPEKLLGTLELSTNMSSPLDRALVQLSGRIVSRLKCDPPAILLSKSDRIQRVRLEIRNRKGPRPRFNSYQVSEASLKAVQVTDVTVALPSERSGDRALDECPLLLDVVFSLAEERGVTSPFDITIRTTEGEVIVPVL